MSETPDWGVDRGRSPLATHPGNPAAPPIMPAKHGHNLLYARYGPRALVYDDPSVWLGMRIVT